MGFLTLSDFVPEFARWKITTRMEEVGPAFIGVLLVFYLMVVKPAI